MSPSAGFQSFRTLLVEPFNHDRPTKPQRTQLQSCDRSEEDVSAEGYYRESSPPLTPPFQLETEQAYSSEGALLPRALSMVGRVCSRFKYAFSKVPRDQSPRQPLQPGKEPFRTFLAVLRIAEQHASLFNVTFKGQRKRWVMKWSVQILGMNKPGCLRGWRFAFCSRLRW